MSDKTGGPAFPQIESETVGDRGEYRERVYSDGGMTLRDYFAAKAMQGLIASPKAHFKKPPEDFARDAFMVADAMLTEREK